MDIPEKKERFKLFAASYVVLVKDGKVLLLGRANTGYEDGSYSMIAGHAEGDESMTSVAVREAREEAGISIKPEDLVLKLMMHRKTDREYADFFFEAKKWEGEVKNCEPQWCSNLNWFPMDNLPENTIPYIRKAIEAYQSGVNYLEIGFEK